jgi:luciferase-type oxidoreductase
MHPRFERLLGIDGFSIGLELPLDNDWSASGQRLREQQGRPFGVPDMSQHTQLARQADDSGFRALWGRDVPLYDPSFGDAAQVFEMFAYLGYLAGVTRNAMLGTAAVVLPLRQPWLTLKSANSVDQLSGGRLLLGVASGDRPMEYPLFEKDFAGRGEVFRSNVELIRNNGEGALPEGAQLLPLPAGSLPLLVAGLAQQTPEWVGQHMDGWLSYPGTPEEHRKRVDLWRQVANDKPYVTFIHLDLDEDPNAPMRRFRFGAQTGSKGLIRELETLREVGVQHVGLHLRRSQREVGKVIEDLAHNVLPHFHRQ